MGRALALIVLSLVAVPMARADDGSDCRNLLAPDEIASAIGGPAELTSAGKRGEVGAGATENSRLQVCAWASVSWLGGVNVDVVPSLEPVAVARGLEVVAFPLDERRARHWVEQRQDFGAVRCSSLAPPEPSRMRPPVTGCVGEVNGAALYVDIVSPAGRPTFDLAKRLFDEAAARL